MELQFEKLAKQILGEGIGEEGAGASASAAHERHKAEQQSYAANRSNDVVVTALFGGNRTDEEEGMMSQIIQMNLNNNSIFPEMVARPSSLVKINSQANQKLFLLTVLIKPVLLFQSFLELKL